MSITERFAKLESYFRLRPTLINDRSINCEILIDSLLALYYECQR